MKEHCIPLDMPYRINRLKRKTKNSKDTVERLKKLKTVKTLLIKLYLIGNMQSLYYLPLIILKLTDIIITWNKYNYSILYKYTKV